MLWDLKQRLARLSRRAAPDRTFVISLRQSLTAAGYLPVRRPWLAMHWQRAAVALSLVGGLGMSATGVYAYSSPDVLPDHPLYGLRTAIEHVELVIAPTPQAKESVRLKHLQRHIAGVRELALKNKSTAVQQAERVLNDVAKEVEAAGKDPAHSAVAPDQKQYLSESVALDKEELQTLADEETSDQNSVDQKDVKESQQIVNQLLVDEADRLEAHVQSLQQHTQEEARTQEDQKQAANPEPSNGSPDNGVPNLD